MKKRVVIIAVVMAIALGSLNVWLAKRTSDPIVLCNIDIPKEYRDVIEQEAKGVYSYRLPLVPVRVSVDRYDMSADRVYYTIYYFPFGSVGMSYKGDDGFFQEKPLTGW